MTLICVLITQLCGSETSGNDCMSSAIENASFLIPTSNGSFSHLIENLGAQQAVIVAGSPGHTPFPVVDHRPRFDFMNTDHLIYDHDDSMPPPPVPCNSPDDAELLEVLKHEAKKQESELRVKMEGRNLMEYFKSPQPLKSRKRRNRKDLCSGMSVEQLEKLSNDKKITEFHSPMSIHDKEVRRRNRISSSVCMLRKIVPGITEDTEKY